MKIALLVVALLLLGACTAEIQEQPEKVETTQSNQEETMVKTQLATFAGGCFWCMEPPFEKLDGVISVTSGYSGGDEENPTYKQVSSGNTGHREAVQIVYDPKKVTYKKLLDVFWRQINPADGAGSFVDRGFQYTSAIYYHDDEQRVLAEKSKALVQKRFEDPVVTEIEPYKSFYVAEDYHQDYYKENPVRYNFYRSRSGRDQFIEDEWFKDNSSIWPEEAVEEVKFVKPSDEELQKALTPIQYKVTQKDGTEPAFDNEYWDNKEDGIYVDVVSGEPLFSSKDKYKSGTGWPSFTQPLEPDNVVTKKDFKLVIPRTEVRSKQSDSHLGHVFNDGPEPTGLRYCMNSAALRFVPKDKLDEEGYGQYLELFNE